MDWIFGHTWTEGWAALSPGLFALGGAAIGLWGASRNSKRQIAHSKMQWRLEFGDRLSQRLRETYPNLVAATLAAAKFGTYLKASADASLDRSDLYTPERIRETQLEAHAGITTTSTELIEILQTMQLLSTDALIDEQLEEIDRLVGIFMNETTSETACRRLDKLEEWAKETQLNQTTTELHEAVTNLAKIMKVQLHQPNLEQERRWFERRPKSGAVGACSVYTSKIERSEKWERYQKEVLERDLGRAN